MKLRLTTLAMLLPLLCGAASQAAPGEEKVLRMFLSTSETGLDPAVASDNATLSLLENLFDPLLRYDYLARPARLRPNTATALPEVSADGLTYTFRIRPGILFTPDPAFKGARREVTAQDYVYSIKRLYDPTLKSPWAYMFEGKIAGDEVLRKRFGHDVPVAGLQALDRHTLRIRLNAPDNNFLFYLATAATGVVAREVIEAYPGQAGNHPVGTGPFMIGDWKRSDRIVLLANPDSTAVFHATPGDNPEDRAIAGALEGKRLPRVDRVEVKIAEEFQGRMLGFLNAEYDYLEQIPESMTDMVVRDGQLKPELAARGIVLSRFPVLQTYYMWMNMNDPVVGGYGKDKVALRRAISMAYNNAEDIALLKKGFAIKAESPLPPNVLGYDPNYRSPVPYDPLLANALLDRHGYTRRDPDGFRRAPDGKPLTLTMHSEATVGGRLRDELWRKCLNSIGLRVVFKSDKKTEIIKASRLGTVQMFESNWIADFPDGDNFYQLLYGPNAGRANYARFNLPAYNQRYEQARLLRDGPARQKLYFEMNQLIHAYNPWVPLTHVLSGDLRHPWLKNYKRHPVEFTTWRYLDVDVAERARSSRAK
ncbi:MULTISPECIES: ABC transporter substrate-binding protein [unclassified Massilia]|uniref:ABC transporter substrate-binding protein n=1 Tax=unclassified Massilia TaxID=2609279 RepID=UPI001B82FB14|nr:MULTISPECIES: ABC transporter substrate-binding protein [unclassified Massilia]MBQ5938712.1 heme-binding protein [Massilia sp. AB1]MBQ5962177.1 heme-binding protein [Massilia sp. ZL223]